MKALPNYLFLYAIVLAIIANGLVLALRKYSSESIVLVWLLGLVAGLACRKIGQVNLVDMSVALVQFCLIFLLLINLSFTVDYWSKFASRKDNPYLEMNAVILAFVLIPTSICSFIGYGIGHLWSSSKQ